MMSSFFDKTEIKDKECSQDIKLRDAFERSRKRDTVSRYEKGLVEHRLRKELLAVNHHSRILWGQAISEQLSRFFCQGGDGSEHDQDTRSNHRRSPIEFQLKT
jgi:hypothetical protein